MDVLLEDEPGEETEGKPSLTAPDEVQINCVDDLLRRDVDVCSTLSKRWGIRQTKRLLLTDDPEILWETVTNEYTAPIHQVP